MHADAADCGLCGVAWSAYQPSCINLRASAQAPVTRNTRNRGSFESHDFAKNAGENPVRLDALIPPARAANPPY